jgi:hypothetical protein
MRQIGREWWNYSWMKLFRYIFRVFFHISQFIDWSFLWADQVRLHRKLLPTYQRLIVLIASSSLLASLSGNSSTMYASCFWFHKGRKYQQLSESLPILVMLFILTAPCLAKHLSTDTSFRACYARGLIIRTLVPTYMLLGNKGTTYFFCISKRATYFFCISSPRNTLGFLLVCTGLWNHICSLLKIGPSFITAREILMKLALLKSLIWSREDQVISRFIKK